MNFRRRQQGFSLMEMMTTTVIVGLLIGATSPMVERAMARAKNASVKYNVRSLETTVQAYALEHNGTYPSSRADFASVTGFPTDLKNPYDPKQKGLSSVWSWWGNRTAYDNSSWKAPIVVWMWGDPGYYMFPSRSQWAPLGAVFYTPYPGETQARRGWNDWNDVSPVVYSGQAGNFTAYTIQGFAIDPAAPDYVKPLPGMRATNWGRVTNPYDMRSRL